MLHFSPRIGLVTRTIALASTDLAHFFAIFLLLGGGFSVIGHLNFGGDVDGFSSLWASCW